jgi:hypothetical protein
MKGRPRNVPEMSPKCPANSAPATETRSERPSTPDPSLDRLRSYADWLDERDARLPAPPDPRVQLMTDSGKTIASTRESNAERMSAALEPLYGPLTTVPA